MSTPEPFKKQVVESTSPTPQKHKTGDSVWVEHQTRVFYGWTNSFLDEHDLKVVPNTNACWKSGLELWTLLFCIAPENTPPPRLPKSKASNHFQELSRLQLCLEFITKKLKIQMVNIGPEDVHAAQTKTILALIWHLITYHLNHTGGALPSSGQTITQGIMHFTAKLLGAEAVPDLTKSWANGKNFTNLIKKIEPTVAIEYDERATPVQTLTKAFQVAEKELGIPNLLDASYVSTDPDEKSIITYLAFYKSYMEPRASRCIITMIDTYRWRIERRTIGKVTWKVTQGANFKYTMKVNQISLRITEYELIPASPDNVFKVKFYLNDEHISSDPSKKSTLRKEKYLAQKSTATVIDAPTEASLPGNISFKVRTSGSGELRLKYDNTFYTCKKHTENVKITSIEANVYRVQLVNTPTKPGNQVFSWFMDDQICETHEIYFDTDELISNLWKAYSLIQVSLHESVKAEQKPPSSQLALHDQVQEIFQLIITLIIEFRTVRARTSISTLIRFFETKQIVLIILYRFKLLSRSLAITLAQELDEFYSEFLLIYVIILKSGTVFETHSIEEFEKKAKSIFERIMHVTSQNQNSSNPAQQSQTSANAKPQGSKAPLSNIKGARKTPNNEGSLPPPIPYSNSASSDNGSLPPSISTPSEKTPNNEGSKATPPSVSTPSEKTPNTEGSLPPSISTPSEKSPNNEGSLPPSVSTPSEKSPNNEGSKATPPAILTPSEKTPNNERSLPPPIPYSNNASSDNGSLPPSISIPSEKTPNTEGSLPPSVSTPSEKSPNTEGSKATPPAIPSPSEKTPNNEGLKTSLAIMKPDTMNPVPPPEDNREEKPLKAAKGSLVPSNVPSIKTQISLLPQDLSDSESGESAEDSQDSQNIQVQKSVERRLSVRNLEVLSKGLENDKSILPTVQTISKNRMNEIEKLRDYDRKQIFHRIIFLNTENQFKKFQLCSPEQRKQFVPKHVPKDLEKASDDVLLKLLSELEEESKGLTQIDFSQIRLRTSVSKETKLQRLTLLKVTTQREELEKKPASPEKQHQLEQLSNREQSLISSEVQNLDNILQNINQKLETFESDNESRTQFEQKLRTVDPTLIPVLNETKKIREEQAETLQKHQKEEEKYREKEEKWNLEFETLKKQEAQAKDPEEVQKVRSALNKLLFQKREQKLKEQQLGKATLRQLAANKKKINSLSVGSPQYQGLSPNEEEEEDFLSSDEEALELQEEISQSIRRTETLKQLSRFKETLDHPESNSPRILQDISENQIQELQSLNLQTHQKVNDRILHLQEEQQFQEFKRTRSRHDIQKEIKKVNEERTVNDQKLQELAKETTKPTRPTPNIGKIFKNEMQMKLLRISAPQTNLEKTQQERLEKLHQLETENRKQKLLEKKQQEQLGREMEQLEELRSHMEKEVETLSQQIEKEQDPGKKEEESKNLSKLKEELAQVQHRERRGTEAQIKLFEEEKKLRDEFEDMKREVLNGEKDKPIQQTPIPRFQEPTATGTPVANPNTTESAQPQLSEKELRELQKKKLQLLKQEKKEEKKQKKEQLKKEREEKKLLQAKKKEEEKEKRDSLKRASPDKKRRGSISAVFHPLVKSLHLAPAVEEPNEPIGSDSEETPLVYETELKKLEDQNKKLVQIRENHKGDVAVMELNIYKTQLDHLNEMKSQIDHLSRERAFNVFCEQAPENRDKVLSEQFENYSTHNTKVSQLFEQLEKKNFQVRHLKLQLAESKSSLKEAQNEKRQKEIALLKEKINKITSELSPLEQEENNLRLDIETKQLTMFIELENDLRPFQKEKNTREKRRIKQENQIETERKVLESTLLKNQQFRSDAAKKIKIHGELMRTLQESFTQEADALLKAENNEEDFNSLIERDTNRIEKEEQLREEFDTCWFLLSESDPIKIEEFRKQQKTRKQLNASRQNAKTKIEKEIEVTKKEQAERKKVLFDELLPKLQLQKPQNQMKQITEQYERLLPIQQNENKKCSMLHKSILILFVQQQEQRVFREKTSGENATHTESEPSKNEKKSEPDRSKRLSVTALLRRGSIFEAVMPSNIQREYTQVMERDKTLEGLNVLKQQMNENSNSDYFKMIGKEEQLLEQLNQKFDSKIDERLRLLETKQRLGVGNEGQTEIQKQQQLRQVAEKQTINHRKRINQLSKTQETLETKKSVAQTPREKRDYMNEMKELQTELDSANKELNEIVESLRRQKVEKLIELENENRQRVEIKKRQFLEKQEQKLKYKISINRRKQIICLMEKEALQWEGKLNQPDVTPEQKQLIIEDLERITKELEDLKELQIQEKQKQEELLREEIQFFEDEEREKQQLQKLMTQQSTTSQEEDPMAEFEKEKKALKEEEDNINQEEKLLKERVQENTELQKKLTQEEKEASKAKKPDEAKKAKERINTLKREKKELLSKIQEQTKSKKLISKRRIVLLENQRKARKKQEKEQKKKEEEEKKLMSSRSSRSGSLVIPNPNKKAPKTSKDYFLASLGMLDTNPPPLQNVEKLDPWTVTAESSKHLLQTLQKEDDTKQWNEFRESMSNRKKPSETTLATQNSPQAPPAAEKSENNEENASPQGTFCVSSTAEKSSPFSNYNEPKRFSLPVNFFSNPENLPKKPLTPEEKEESSKFYDTTEDSHEDDDQDSDDDETMIALKYNIHKTLERAENIKGLDELEKQLGSESLSNTQKQRLLVADQKDKLENYQMAKTEETHQDLQDELDRAEEQKRLMVELQAFIQTLEVSPKSKEKIVKVEPTPAPKKVLQNEPTPITKKVVQTEDEPTVITKKIVQSEEPTIITKKVVQSEEPTIITRQFVQSEEPTITTQKFVQTEGTTIITKEIIHTKEPTIITRQVVQSEEPTIITRKVVQSEEPTIITRKVVQSEEPTIITRKVVQSEGPTTTAVSSPRTEQIKKRSELRKLELNKLREEEVNLKFHIGFAKIENEPEKEELLSSRLVTVSQQTRQLKAVHQIQTQLEAKEMVEQLQVYNSEIQTSLLKEKQDKILYEKAEEEAKLKIADRKEQILQLNAQKLKLQTKLMEASTSQEKQQLEQEGNLLTHRQNQIEVEKEEEKQKRETNREQVLQQLEKRQEKIVHFASMRPHGQKFGESLRKEKQDFDQKSQEKSLLIKELETKQTKIETELKGLRETKASSEEVIELQEKLEQVQKQVKREKKTYHQMRVVRIQQLHQKTSINTVVQNMKSTAKPMNQVLEEKEQIRLRKKEELEKEQKEGQQRQEEILFYEQQQGQWESELKKAKENNASSEQIQKLQVSILTAKKKRWQLMGQQQKSGYLEHIKKQELQKVERDMQEIYEFEQYKYFILKKHRPTRKEYAQKKKMEKNHKENVKKECKLKEKETKERSKRRKQRLEEIAKQKKQLTRKKTSSSDLEKQEQDQKLKDLTTEETQIVEAELNDKRETKFQIKELLDSLEREEKEKKERIAQAKRMLQQKKQTMTKEEKNRRKKEKSVSDRHGFSVSGDIFVLKNSGASKKTTENIQLNPDLMTKNNVGSEAHKNMNQSFTYVPTAHDELRLLLGTEQMPFLLPPCKQAHTTTSTQCLACHTTVGKSESTFECAHGHRTHESCFGGMFQSYILNFSEPQKLCTLCLKEVKDALEKEAENGPLWKTAVDYELEKWNEVFSSKGKARIDWVSFGVLLRHKIREAKGIKQVTADEYRSKGYALSVITKTTEIDLSGATTVLWENQTPEPLFHGDEKNNKK